MVSSKVALTAQTRVDWTEIHWADYLAVVTAYHWVVWMASLRVVNLAHCWAENWAEMTAVLTEPKMAA